MRGHAADALIACNVSTAVFVVRVPDPAEMKICHTSQSSRISANRARVLKPGHAPGIGGWGGGGVGVGGI